ncbi:hypothetical protein FF1_004427 [Malus domestica]
MGKPTKGKKSKNLGKGMVTPIQIAFIVDRYLCDNNYLVTLSLFKTEASSLIAKSPIQEAPKSLLSVLNTYNASGSPAVSAPAAVAPQSFNLLVSFYPTRSKR